MNDVAFQFVFGRNERKQNLKSLLRAILGDDCLIESIVLNETELTPDLLDGKNCRLDLLAMTQAGEQVSIEVQIANHGNMLKRSLFYWSRLFTSQLEKGQDYHELKKVIAINILDFSLLKTSEFYTVGKLVDTQSNELLTDILDIRFLELSKIERSMVDLGSPLNRWLLFLNSRTERALREEILMVDEEILAASEDLEKLRLDKQALRLYEMREKYVMDEQSARRFHYEQGKAEGKAEGKEEGKAEGKAEGKVEGQEEGRAEGRKLEQIHIARQMLKEGMDEQLICRVLGLDLDELRDIT